MKTLIIVPAYNEEENILQTLEEIRRIPGGPDVVVIDDGSSDLTAQKALEAGAHVISLPFNLGIGGAVQTGFQYARDKGYDTAVQVDADGQHDVSFLKDLLQPVINGQADIVVGSRFVQSSGYKASFLRRAGIEFFAHLISFLIGQAVTDSTSGFRAFNKAAIGLFSEDYPADFPEPESIVIARRAGLKIVEIPVKMRQRQHGHSSIRYFYTLYYMVKVTFAILLNMIKKKK